MSLERFPQISCQRAIAAVDDELQARYGDGVRASTGMTRRLYRDNEEFRAFAFESGLATLAAQATASDTIRLYFEQVFVKDPGATEVFHWHQDNPFWPISGTQVCSTWVALTAASVESSALEFVRGSHAWGITYRPYFGGPDRGRQAQPGLAQVRRVRGFVPGRSRSVRGSSRPIRARRFRSRTGRRPAVRLPNRSSQPRQRKHPTPRRGVMAMARRRARWDPVPGADPVVSSADTWLEPGALITDDDAFPIVHSSHAAIQT